MVEARPRASNAYPVSSSSPCSLLHTTQLIDLGGDVATMASIVRRCCALYAPEVESSRIFHFQQCTVRHA